MFTVLIRTIILYLLVLITMRIMGKRQVGQLEPFELAITIMISELASLPMQDNKIPLIHGVIPIITLLLMEVIIAVLQLKSEKSRLLLTGKPSILIRDGKIDIKELRTQQFNLNDLFEELRLQGYFNLSDIQVAILETSGQLSIIPKTDNTPATKKDMNVKSTQENLPITLILDGNINEANLKVAGKNRSWLISQLNKNNINAPEKVFIAMLDTKGTFVYQLKGDEK